MLSFPPRLLHSYYNDTMTTTSNLKNNQMAEKNKYIGKLYLPNGAQSHQLSRLSSSIKVPGGGETALQFRLKTFFTTLIGFLDMWYAV